MTKSRTEPRRQPAAGVIICALAVFAAATTGAQNLSTAREGRVVVGQCYAACMDKAFKSAATTHEKSTRLTELMISDDFFQLTDQSQDDFIALYRLDVCLLAQNHIRGVDACYAGCVDVDQAYGLPGSNARSRFYQLLREERQPFQDAGLWQDYRTFPVFGSYDFEDACERLYENGAVVAEAQASPAHAPSSLVNRLIRMEQRLERKPQANPVTQANADTD
ncbi:MAG: hypothetical protein F4089_11670 [Gammaproteobacteria bacterium]|nr:hypothetical protein [Gammaproteobacteria bacterium]MYJ75708.1 hypothetical protein [Gammaproteobacteria bacterium]